MSLRACRDCGTEISRQAASCPHCGRKNPTQTDFEKISGGHSFNYVMGQVIGGAILILLILISHYCFGSSITEKAVTMPIPVSISAPVEEKSYKATITCTTLGGGKTVVHACFVAGSQYGSDTSLKITTNNQSQIYHATDIMRMAGNNFALGITLPEHFEIMAQNARRYVTLGVTIKDEDGKVVFSDQADQYHTIHVSN